MRFRAFIVLIAAAAILAAGAAEAAPVLTGASPADNSFIKGAANFSVNASGADTNANSALLFIVSEDARNQGEEWDNYTLSCSSTGQNTWACSRQISFGIVGSNTVEMFYFEAADNSGSKTYLGSRSSPMKVTLDRVTPSLYFSSPLNNSYASGNALMKVSVSDPLSGIDGSSVEFYFNGSWTSAPSGEMTVNTLAHADNASLSVTARANDKAGNKVNTSVTFIVDNTAPSISITSPQNNAYVSGYQTFAVSASDTLAGIGTGKVRMRLGSLDYTLVCSGSGQYDCSVIVDTTLYSNGLYNASFTATDQAGNSRQASVNVNVNNAQSGTPSVKIGVSQNEYMRGVKSVTASVTNHMNVVTGVVLNFNSQNFPMTCNLDFSSCSYSLDTRSFADNSYTFTATANNGAGYTIKDSVTGYIDNTPPAASISVANVTKGAVPVGIAITDENPKATGLVFRIGSTDNALSCGLSGKTASCTYQLDTTALADGLNTIGVAGSDGTGNAFSSYKGVYVDNNAPTLRFLKVTPIEAASPSPIEFSVGLDDAGTSVKSARVVVRGAEFTGNLDLNRTSDVWYGKGVLISYGSHSVDVEATDEGGNVAQHKNKGSVFVGNLSCGDGVCGTGESYCNCQKDCSTPSCSANYAVDCSSGIAVCSLQQKCGDKVCGSAEMCSSCSSDCGSCSGILEIVKSSTNTDGSLAAISNATPITIIKKGETETEYVYVGDIQATTIFAIVIVAVAIAVVATVIIKKRTKKEYDSFLTPSSPEKF